MCRLLSSVSSADRGNVHLQAGLFGVSRRLLRTLWSQSVWDAAALYGGVGLFLAIAAGIVIRRINYFVPMGTILAPAAGLLWNATRAAGGRLAPVFQRPPAALPAQAAAAGAVNAAERPLPDDLQWAESDWELDADAEAAAANEETLSGEAESAEAVQSSDGTTDEIAAKEDSEFTADDSAPAELVAPSLIKPAAGAAVLHPAVDDAANVEQESVTAAAQQPRKPSSSAEALQPEVSAISERTPDAAAEGPQPSEPSESVTDESTVLPPAIAARLSEIETAYQDARVEIERAAAAHDAASERASAAPEGSEAAAVAEREVDAAAAEHGAAVAAAQEALREAAELQEEASGGLADAEYEDAADTFDSSEQDTDDMAENTAGHHDSMTTANAGVSDQRAILVENADGETVMLVDSTESSASEAVGSNKSVVEDEQLAPALVLPLGGEALMDSAIGTASGSLEQPRPEIAVEGDASSYSTAEESRGDSSETIAASGSAHHDEALLSVGAAGSSEPSEPVDSADVPSAESGWDGVASDPADSGDRANGRLPAEVSAEPPLETPHQEAAAGVGAAAAAAPALKEWRWEGSEAHPQGRWVERCYSCLPTYSSSSGRVIADSRR